MSEREHIQHVLKENGVTYRLRFNRYDDARSYQLTTTDSNTRQTFQTGYVWIPRDQAWTRSTGDPELEEFMPGCTSAEVHEAVGAFARIVDAVGHVPLPLDGPITL